MIHAVGMMRPGRRHGPIGATSRETRRVRSGATEGRRNVSTSVEPVRPRQEERSIRGTGRAVFAATLLLLVGTINIIYGIGALDGANIFVNDQRYVLTDLNTLGWVVIVLGVVQLAAGFSLMAGNAFGRVLGIIAGSLGAIGALLSIGGNDPWWSLAVFVLCVYVVHGIIVYGRDERAVGA